MRFVDTNILLYLVSTDPSERHKQAIAAEILAARDLSLSTQVLQEFYVQATRLTRSDALPHDTAIKLIRSWKRYPVVPIDIELVEAAFQAKARWQLSYWDAAILEAARRNDCELLLSEDLSDGQDYDGIKVMNPFAS